MGSTELVCKQHQHKRDRISKLPEAILQEIILYLPAREAARTSILSRAWRNIRKSVPMDDFLFSFRGEPSELLPSVEGSLSKVLDRDKATCQVWLFQLLLPNFPDQHPNSAVETTFALVAKYSTRELELRFSTCQLDDNYGLELDALSVIKSLVVLRLKGCSLTRQAREGQQHHSNNNNDSDIGGIDFPCLKEIDLLWVGVSQAVLGDLLLGCKSLETISLTCSKVRTGYTRRSCFTGSRPKQVACAGIKELLNLIRPGLYLNSCFRVPLYSKHHS